MKGYFYILRSRKDNKQYLGSTLNYNKRLHQHNSGLVHSTKGRRPFLLVGYQECETIQEAAKHEKIYKRSHGVLERAIRNGKITMITDGV